VSQVVLRATDVSDDHEEDDDDEEN